MWEIRRIATAATCVLVLMPMMQAQPAERPAWDWTTEERLAVRTDAEAARARVEKSERRQRRAAQATRPVDTITGKDNPELFLPHQVFEELVHLAFMRGARDGEMLREGFSIEAKPLELPADFWDRLRTITTIYQSDLRAFSEANKQAWQTKSERDRQIVAQRYDIMCRSRAEALSEARKAFGRQRFDRFLYGVVVRGMFSTAFSPVNGELLRRAEEGCR